MWLYFMSRRDYIFVENNCKNLVCPVVGYPSVYDGLLLSLEGASCFVQLRAWERHY
jgi:hypothetical protein